MMMLQQRTLIIISGLIWFIVGVGLLGKGLNFLMDIATGISQEANYPLLGLFSLFSNHLEQAVILIIVLGLFVGFLKGKYVLGKSAKKGIERILNMANPSCLTKIYSAKYYILLGGMMAIGLSMNYFGVYQDVRGFVDVAVGAALINGSMFYFRTPVPVK